MRYDDQEMLARLNAAMRAAEMDGFDGTAKAIEAVLLELKGHRDVVTGIGSRAPSKKLGLYLSEIPVD